MIFHLRMAFKVVSFEMVLRVVANPCGPLPLTNLSVWLALFAWTAETPLTPRSPAGQDETEEGEEEEEEGVATKGAASDPPTSNFSKYAKTASPSRTPTHPFHTPPGCLPRSEKV